MTAPSGGPQSGWRPVTASSGRVRPVRLIAVFVVTLVVVLAVIGVIVAAVEPAPPKPDCPNPGVPCGAPPIQPSFAPVARSSPTPQPTPVATVTRPLASGAAPTAGVSLPPSPSANGSAGPFANLPEPRPTSNASPLRAGEVWTSSGLGFQVEYDDGLWVVEQDSATNIVLSAGRGLVVVEIEGFASTATSPSDLVKRKERDLRDVILGLTPETAADRTLPGHPAIGFRDGEGAVFSGTTDSAQGPSSNVSVVVMAATDGQLSLRATVVADDSVREDAFSVADDLLNSVVWPGDAT